MKRHHKTVLRLETDERVLLGTATLINCTTDGESFQKVTITIKKDPNLTVFTCPTYNTCVTNFPGYFYKESLSTPNKIVVGITAVTMDDIAWTCQYELENAPKAQKNLPISDSETVLRLETDERVLLGTATLINCTTDGESFQKVTITIKKDPNLTVFTCPTYNTCVTNFPGYFYKESLSTPNKIVVGITAVTMDDIAWTCQYELENAPKAQKNLPISDSGTSGGYCIQAGPLHLMLWLGYFFILATSP
ncbi:uncharacterized protein [Haliotis cracherodii]|uniref:uncharacterized protein n=1 Tax=Haliotis cracherodii TaxID=6455 RepID=UPI0039E88C1E